MTQHPFSGGYYEDRTPEPSGSIDPYDAVLLLFSDGTRSYETSSVSGSFASVNDDNITSAGDKVRAAVTRIFNDTSDYEFSSVQSVLNGVGGGDGGLNVVTERVVDDATILTSADNIDDVEGLNNWWAMLALVLVVGTAAGNILVCLAIAWERRLQNVTNYFLMSLAVTDLMVAVLVMPLGILTLVRGKIIITQAQNIRRIIIS